MNNKINSLLTSINIDTIEDLYIKQNLDKKTVAKSLNISLWSLSNLLKQYKITKSKDLIKKTREQTCIEKYGVKNAGQSEIIKEKIKESNREKYGVNYYLSTKEAHEKGEQTKLERYGSKTYNNSDKTKLTKKIKYNDENYNNRKKCKETVQERYGVDNVFQLASVKETVIDSIINNKEYSKEFKKYINNKDASIKFLKDKNYSYFDLVKIFNAPYYTIQQWIVRLSLQDYINYTFTGKSHYEDDIIEYITSLNNCSIIRNSKILDGLEIDIYLPEYKLGIEFNDTYWHSDLFKKDNYHQSKSIEAMKQGIRLIHIYQYEWNNLIQQNKIKSIIKSALGIYDNKIYARDCTVKVINDKEASAFNNANHIQNHRKARLTYGLFYKDKLVQLMSFSHNRKYEWEIIRSCSLLNTNIVGGISKLFKHFVDDNNPSEVFSYCDLNKFNGKGYLQLNMSNIGITKPDLKYVIKDTVINRQPNNYKKIKSLVDYRIYGAGSLKYLWKK